MVILNQSGRYVIDWAKIKKAYISTGSKGNAVIASFEDGDTVVLGTYRTEGQCSIALGKLFHAITEGGGGYQFPQPEELPVSKAHYGSGGGRNHGGS